MRSVYFILDLTDNNNPKISTNPLTVIKSQHPNDRIVLQMLRDLDYCGKSKGKTNIIGFIVKVSVTNYCDYLQKASQLVNKYKNYQEDVFINDIYQKIIKFDYLVDPENPIQYMSNSNATVKFSINQMEENGDKYWYWCNPEFNIYND